ncbi:MULTISPECIES: abortive infection family protein [unclassified Microcoleus]|uniref:abortive infection family protein n=1 Tax=unclassified Microcoleus TaxID=2642155 RepID=UPI002FD19BD2
MSADWYPGIRAFCQHWSHAQTLQNTFATLEQTFAEEQDACIDAAKAMVECACRVIIANLDDPISSLKPVKNHPSIGDWLSAAVRVLKLGEVRDSAFQKLISEHHNLTKALGALRDKAGTVSHGKEGFISKLSIHHRRAAILAADAIVTFLHEAYLDRELDPLLTLEPYDRFALSNEAIDKHTALVVDEDQENGFLSLIVLLPNGDEIPLSIEPSRLLFGIDRQAYKAALDACKDAELMKPESVESP